LKFRQAFKRRDPALRPDAAEVDTAIGRARRGERLRTGGAGQGEGEEKGNRELSHEHLPATGCANMPKGVT
jgi:hypothetical protein